MKPEELRNLIGKARRGRPEESAEAPFGFAGRVAARWARGGSHEFENGLVVWERLTRWGLAGALAACVVMVALDRVSSRATEAPSSLEIFAGLVDDEDSF